jgi:hypothetical protein
VGAWIERWRWVVLVTLAGLWAVLLAARAYAKPFWHDEVYTILLSQLSIAQAWRAGIDGADLSPPLNTFLTHLVHAIAGVGPVSTRVPAMAGFLAAAVLLFLTVRHRTGPIMGLAAPFMLFATPAVDYAVEARGYGLSLAWFALALAAWTQAAAGRKATLHWLLMAVGLAAGLWTHYYSVLAFIPIGLGEAVRQWQRRRFQPAPWVALAGAAAALLPLWNFLGAAADARATFWARAGEQDLGSAYRYVLKDLPDRTWTLAILALIIALELLRRWRSGRSSRRLQPHDLAACLGCLAIPAAGLALGHGLDVFSTRYLVFATVGLAFAIPQLLWWLLPDTGAGDVLVAVALAWPIGVLTVDMAQPPPRRTVQAEQHPWLVEWLRTPEPVAMTGGVEYLGLWYSLPEPARPRAVYLADPEMELRHTGSDTVDRNYLALARWTPVPVVRADVFVRTHSRFWLYSYRPSPAETRLRQSNATLREIVRDPSGDGTIYEVTVAPD